MRLRDYWVEAMKRDRNSVIILLMGSSIALLVVLQCMWIRSSFHDAEDDFRKETSALFRATILAMHDSLIQRNLRPVADSAFGFVKDRIHIADSSAAGQVLIRDSIHDFIIGKREARIDVLFSGDDEDSIRSFLPPIMRRMQKDSGSKTFIFRIGPDSLRRDSISKEYRRVLLTSGIDIPFTVHVISRERVRKTMKRAANAHHTEIVRLDPVHAYRAAFPEIDSLLIRQITPQILFSAFLTLLTIGAFYVTYKSLRSQQKLMMLKNDFISNITHELKTPVATVSVALEALKKFNALNNPQRTAEYLEIAQNELTRLTLMTDKILKTSVFETRGVDLNVDLIDLDQLTQRVLGSMKLVFDKKKMQVNFERAGADFKLEGSEADITNVMYNLIDNAVKYSPDGSALTVKLINGPHEVCIEVRDQGIGIAKEYHKKVFEKFFRVPSGDVHNVKGYGLGLSYVAGVVASHDGSISVDSEPGKGSSFQIKLPKRHEG